MTNKEKIIARLKEFTKEQGILFTSEEDAVNYYKELVELIEELKDDAYKLPYEMDNA